MTMICATTEPPYLGDEVSFKATVVKDGDEEWQLTMVITTMVLTF